MTSIPRVIATCTGFWQYLNKRLLSWDCRWFSVRFVLLAYRISKNCRHPLFVSANECSVETTLIYLHIHDRPGAGAPSSLDLD